MISGGGLEPEGDSQQFATPTIRSGPHLVGSKQSKYRGIQLGKSSM